MVDDPHDHRVATRRDTPRIRATVTLSRPRSWPNSGAQRSTSHDLPMIIERSTMDSGAIHDGCERDHEAGPWRPSYPVEKGCCALSAVGQEGHRHHYPAKVVVVMRAADVMTRPVWTVREKDPLEQAAALLSSHDITAAPVVDAAGDLVGIVSEGDLLRARTVHDASGTHLVGPEGSSATIVSDVMTCDVITV